VGGKKEELLGEVNGFLKEKKLCEVLNTPEIVMSTKIPKEIRICPFVR
jgi:hypothetical protein